MSTVSKRTVKTTRHEYTVPKPSNWAEVDKATALARHDLEASGRQLSDDALWFDADDDHIFICWEERS